MTDQQAAETLRTMEREIRSAMDGVGEGGGWMTGATENYRPYLLPLERGADAIEMLEWLSRGENIKKIKRTSDLMEWRGPNRGDRAPTLRLAIEWFMKEESRGKTT